MKKIISSLAELEDFAKVYAQKIKGGDIICLYGDLGSGKTTFTNYLTKELGFKDKVQSPTFVIARRYYRSNSNLKTINHVDLYRITKEIDIADLSLEDYFNDTEAITIIEWPGMIEEKLKSYDHKKLKFIYLDENSREIDYQD